MANNLPIPLEQGALPDMLQAEVARAAEYAKASRSPATRRAYASDWEIFTLWCDERGIESLPATPTAV